MLSQACETRSNFGEPRAVCRFWLARRHNSDAHVRGTFCLTRSTTSGRWLACANKSSDSWRVEGSLPLGVCRTVDEPPRCTPPCGRWSGSSRAPCIYNFPSGHSASDANSVQLPQEPQETRSRSTAVCTVQYCTRSEAHLL